MVWFLNGILNIKAQTFEICTNGCHFVKNHLKPRQKRPDFEKSSFRIVGTIAIAKAQPFEILPSKSPDFKCFQILNGQISDTGTKELGESQP